MGSEILSLVNKSSKHRQQACLKKLEVVKVNDVQITMWLPHGFHCLWKRYKQQRLGMCTHTHTHTHKQHQAFKLPVVEIIWNIIRNGAPIHLLKA